MSATASANDLDDAELSGCLSALAPSDLVCLVLTKSNAQLRRVRPDGVVAQVLGQGDVGTDAQKALLHMANHGRVLLADATTVESAAALTSDLACAKVSRSELQQRLKAFNSVAFGRAGEVSAATARTVCTRAAWRCQFDGCGKNLSEHALTGAAGNFSYLAHIVAASPQGPRGSDADSARLADDPDNILLLCDGCHRLIDRVEPDTYKVDVLRDMRQRSVLRVRELLDSLEFDEYSVLTVIGDISGQNSVFDEAEAHRAMRANRMRPARGTHSFLRGPMDQPINTTAAHWQAQRESMEQDLASLKTWLNGASRGGHAPERLAVFPLHNTSKLVLAGRVVGEARTVRLFQFRRDLAGGVENQWDWPPDVPSPEDDMFCLEGPESTAEIAEGTLLYFLSDMPPDLPEHLLSLPTWRLSAKTPGRGVINHPASLDRVASLVDDVLTGVERLGLSRLHVVAIAPASALFRLGQKLQARHHVKTTLYERSQRPDDQGRQPFVQTLEISTDSVNLGGGESIRL